MRAELFGVLFISSAWAGVAHAQVPPTSGEQLVSAVAESVQRFGLPETWIRAVMRRESGGDARATSPKGAMGLMQLMPDTWATLRGRLHLGPNPYDVHDNVVAGVAYLRQLYDQFGADGFLAAYNAGPHRYLEYVSKGRPLPDETRAYVAAIVHMLGGPDVAVQPLSASVIATAAPPPPPSVFVRLSDGFATRPTQPSGLFIPASDK
jgi:soluble lytic murein transglycosylase-like protein